MSKRRRRSPGVEERRARRRIQLLEAADRVIRRDGPAASMDDIAAEARIAKPVLYRHFGDKGGLYQALTERYVRALMDAMREALGSSTDPRTRLAATIDAYLAFIEHEHEAYRFLRYRALREQPEAQATVVDFIRQVAAEVSVAVREELVRFGLDTGGAHAWAHGIVGMAAVAGDWWFEKRTISRGQLVDYLVALVWPGFARLTQRRDAGPGRTGAREQGNA